MSSTIWAPALFLGFFAAVAGLVNYERFGNPLVFNDFKYYIRFLGDAKFIENYDGNGVFNFHRIWYGAIYYFFPVWIAHGEAGRLIFAQFRDRFVSGIELPVSSFLISDPLLLAFGWRGAERLFGRSASLVMPRWTRAGLLAALAIPGMLMLIMIFYAYRYRAEFYPAFLFAALVGFYDVGSSPKLSALKRFAAPLALWTVVASIALWFFYQLSHFGGAEGQLEHGLIDLIKSELQHAFRYFSGD